MRAVVAKLIYVIVVAEVLAGLVVGFLAYFTRSFNQSTHLWFDGLGRKLEDTPFIARFIFGADSQWAGWGYFVLDLVVFWGGVAVAIGLLTLAAKFDKKTDA
jgi:hypothetical protein